MARWAVIMAGGSGTRFWPASRSMRPKQLLPLVASPKVSEGAQDESEEVTLLGATIQRLAGLLPIERTLVVTAEHLVGPTRAAVPGLLAENVLAEPAARNTAPCIGWATREILSRDPEAVIAVLPSDHYVRDVAGFVQTLDHALAVAMHIPLVTVGIAPTRPDTGFGYIESGAKLTHLTSGELSIHSLAAEVVRFVEKPDRQRAEAFLASGGFTWNSGMFFFRATAMNEAITKHLPALSDGLDQMGSDPTRIAAIFPTLPSVSIDVGVVEAIARDHLEGKTGVSIAVLEGNFGWSDVGSWESAYEFSQKDEGDNAAPANTIFVDAYRNLVRNTSSKAVALVGVSDLVVIETDDALLVMPRERAQDVRAVVQALKDAGRHDKL